MDIHAEQRREVQLDAIASLMIVALLIVVGLLFYLVSQAGVLQPGADPLSSYPARVLLTGFTLLVLLYLWDQRQRLRREVQRKTHELNRAARWLALSHRSASTLAERGIESGLDEVLVGIADLLQADAAAVLGDQMSFVHVRQGISTDEVDRVLMHVAIEAVGHPEPMRIRPLQGQCGGSVAIPLRVDGVLRFVLCTWREDGLFHDEEIDALGLAGRVIELAIEREESLVEARSQLEGTLGVLQYLGADHSKDYGRHSHSVAELAGAIGQRMGLTVHQCRDLRMAGLIHDVGHMTPAGMVDSNSEIARLHEIVLIEEQHARIGAEIAQAANFGPEIQEAIWSHHERPDGTGHPRGLSGEGIPLQGRILAVCEAFDELCGETTMLSVFAQRRALAKIRRGAGTQFDTQVVRTLCQLIEEENPPVEPEPVSVANGLFADESRADAKCILRELAWVAM